MKRICFEDAPLFAERSSLEQIEQILRDLLQEGPVECWFFGCHSTIADQAVEIIMKLRNEDSEVKLQVIDIVDPISEDSDKYRLGDTKEEKDDFPKGVVNRLLYAPLLSGKAEHSQSHVIAHAKKLRRWMWEQCDIIVFYYYENLPDPDIQRILKWSEKCDIELIHIWNKDTYHLIEEKMATVEGEDGILLSLRKRGDTFRCIGEQLHMSGASATQKTRLALYRLERIIKAELKRRNNYYPEFPKLAYRLEHNITDETKQGG